MRKFIGALILSLLLVHSATGQIATVKRTVNLWPSPSTEHEPVGKLTPPLRLRLLEPSPTGGFYHVKTTDGREGWVWGTDLILEKPSSEAAETNAVNNAPSSSEAAQREPSANARNEEQQSAETMRYREQIAEAEQERELVRASIEREREREKARRDQVQGASSTDQEPGGRKNQEDVYTTATKHRRSHNEAALPSPTPSPKAVRKTTGGLRISGIPNVIGGARISVGQSPSTTETPTTQAYDDRLQQAIDAIKLGQEVFHHPEAMELRKPEIVQVRISHDLEEDLTKGFATQGVTERDQIPVSTVMKVHLVGDPYFEVKPISDERQLVTMHKPNEWSFMVLPVKGGKWPLHLVITAVIHTPWGTDEYKDFPVKDEIVLVRVTALSFTKSFFIENWQWLWATLFIPLAAFFWKRRQERTKIKESSVSVAA